jgi:hypothetical protein
MIAIVMELVAALDSPRSGFLSEEFRSPERFSQDLQADNPATPLHVDCNPRVGA